LRANRKPDVPHRKTIDLQLLATMTRAIAPAVPEPVDNVRYLHAPATPADVSLPPDRLTVEEIALIRRSLPAFLRAMSACPILQAVE
jgi:hypothetical protein